MEQTERLKLLKQILLKEEKETSESLIEKVEQLSGMLNEPQKLAAKVDPLIDNKIKELVKEMPKTLSPIITKSLRAEVENSQDAVVEALFPIIGKLIKKYIAREMELLNERINSQIKKAFSFKNFFRSIFRKKSLADDLIVSTAEAQLEQVLVIEKKSGILVANYKSNQDSEVMDEELVAGMLTAIKSFVEDAFKSGEQSLESITYELQTLHIQNFYNYYIVAVVSGNYTLQVKEKLENKILDFAEKGVSKQDLVENEVFSERLKIFFSEQVI